MSGNSCDMLSLKWNNHSVSFLHTLNHVRMKESLCDVTIACEGNLYLLHKLVLSNCSEYFQQIFESISSKHPVIVLAGVDKASFEVLLNYMYIGEVNVEQQKLACLIKAAECLKIKGLAVPDTDYDNEEKVSQKRSLNNSHYSRIRKKHKLNSVTEEKKNVIDEGNTAENEEKVNDANSNEYDSSDQRELNLYKKEINSELNDCVTERVIKSEHLENDVKGENSNSAIYGDDSMEQLEINEQQINQYEEILPTADYMNSSAPPWELNDILNSNSFIQNNEDCSSKMVHDPQSSAGFVDNLISVDHLPEIPLNKRQSRLTFHSCSQCDYKTAYKTRLAEHFRKHTGEKPYSCPFCNHKSAKKSNLKVHIRTIHEQLSF